MDQNPYASPAASGPPQSAAIPGSQLGQVKAIAICSIVQGSLEVVYGIFYIAMGTFFLIGGPNMGPGQGQMPAMEQEFIMTMMMVVYGVIGGLAILSGGFRIFAGVQYLRLRGRLLGIISFFAGLSNLLTCYCLPTAIGLCVWGCIIYFNPGVVQAFNLRKQGLSVAQIQQGQR